MGIHVNSDFIRLGRKKGVERFPCLMKLWGGGELWGGPWQESMNG